MAMGRIEEISSPAKEKTKIQNNCLMILKRVPSLSCEKTPKQVNKQTKKINLISKISTIFM